jgi:adenylylsulfate kinase
MYKKAKANEIKNFTGISSPYEVPESPDLVINTDKETLSRSVDQVMGILIDKGIVNHALV